MQGDLKSKQKEKELAEEEDFGNTTWGRLRSWLWNTMEYPWTSKLAQVFTFFCQKCALKCQKLSSLKFRDAQVFDTYIPIANAMLCMHNMSLPCISILFSLPPSYPLAWS